MTQGIRWPKKILKKVNSSARIQVKTSVVPSVLKIRSFGLHVWVRQTILALVDPKRPFWTNRNSSRGLAPVLFWKKICNSFSFKDTEIRQESFFVRKLISYQIPGGNLVPTHNKKVSLFENPFSKWCNFCQILIHLDLGKNEFCHREKSL